MILQAKSIHVAPSSKAQEDAELDRAILESEKERDNIQVIPLYY